MVLKKNKKTMANKMMKANLKEERKKKKKES
jgi:hypothetical protein